MKQYQLYIDRKWQNSQSGDWFESHDPFADEAWALIPRANEEDVNRAIDAASKAFHSNEWRGMTATARGAAVRTYLGHAGVRSKGSRSQAPPGWLAAKVTGV